MVTTQWNYPNPSQHNLLSEQMYHPVQSDNQGQESRPLNAQKEEWLRGMDPSLLILFLVGVQAVIEQVVAKEQAQLST